MITSDLFVIVSTNNDIKKMVASYHDTAIKNVMFATTDAVLMEDTCKALENMGILPLPLMTMSETDIPITSGFSSPIVKGIHINYADIEAAYSRSATKSMINERIDWCTDNMLAMVISHTSWQTMASIAKELSNLSSPVLFVADFSYQEGISEFMDVLYEATHSGISTGLIVGLRDLHKNIGGSRELAHTFAPGNIKSVGLGSIRPIVSPKEIEELYSIDIHETITGDDTSMAGDNILTMIAGGYRKRPRW
jgi:hypothetical protein